jgi:hypothetical protein
MTEKAVAFPLLLCYSWHQELNTMHKESKMLNEKCLLGLVIAICAAMLLGGCVERRLTIVTEPSEAIVWLNDEEIGQTPVTVNFNWYGDYNVRIEKPGYEILNTHRVLERPLNDKFPFDFFAELRPKKIENVYTWTFELEPFQPTPSADLVEAAHELRKQANNELGKIAVEVLTEE